VKTAPMAAIVIVAVIKPLNRIPIEPISSSAAQLVSASRKRRGWRHPSGRPTS
jgi:hypothetical protein